MQKDNRRPVILSVDDDQDAHVLLKRALAKIGSGALLVSCCDGSEAIDYFSGAGGYSNRENFPLPDLLLLDLKMAKVSGFGVLEFVRSQSAFAKLPVIVFSSSNHEKDVTRAYALGCDSYMVKPCKFQDLVAVIQEIESAYLGQMQQQNGDSPGVLKKLEETPVVDDKPAKSRIAVDSPENFKLLVEQVKDYAIFMLDAKGFISSWNQGARNIKGYTSNEIIGKHFSIFYTPEAVARNHPAHELTLAIRDGRYEEEGWRVRKDGSQFWASVVITALWDKQGNLTGFAKVTRDLTHRKREEDALRQKNEALEMFAQTLSHDLRAPLRSLSSFAEILQCESDELSEKEKKFYLEKISRSAQTMNALITDILKVSQLSLTPAPEEVVSLREVLNEALVINELEIKRTRARIEFKNQLPEILGNRTLLLQIFMNLLSNALKFTRDGEPPRIQISSLRKNGHCEISVKDFGAGIPEQFLDSIFNLFERGAAATHISGTGVGLAIVKRAVERLGGTVAVQSRENEGSEFIVSLPCNSPAIPAVNKRELIGAF